MELRHLRYFLAVAEELNFTRAARRIGIGQPPLSQQIGDLEHELGTRLFHRRPHGVELTAAGQAFLPEAQGVMAQAARAVRAAGRAAQGATGTLRVGFTGSAIFHPLVAATVRAYREAYPAVELSLEEKATAGLLEQLNAGIVDAAFIRPGNEAIAGCRVDEIDEEAVVVALPSRHPLAAARQVRLTDLASEHLILFPRTAGPGLYDDLLRGCRQAGFEPVLAQPAPQITSMAPLVAAGLGVALVPESMQRTRVEGVKYRPLLGRPLVARLAIATRLEDPAATVAHFIRMARAQAVAPV